MMKQICVCGWVKRLDECLFPWHYSVGYEQVICGDIDGLSLHFLPSALGAGGVFTQTTAGSLFFIFFLIYGLWLYSRFPYVTRPSTAATIKFPLKTLGLLATIFLSCWFAPQMFGSNWIAARLGIGLASSLIELVLIYNDALCLSVLIVFLWKRARKDRIPV
jgi:hypothetical protein